MSEHEHELPTRSLGSFRAEIDYWRALLADLGAANAALMEAAVSAAETPLLLLELLVAEEPAAKREQARESAKRTQTGLLEVSRYIEAMAELANGRAMMLNREAAGEL